LRRRVKLLLGVGAVFVLGLVAVGREAERIEARVEQAINKRLTDEFPWVDAAAEGQKAILSGTPPSAAAAERAAALAKDGAGVLTGPVTAVETRFSAPREPVHEATWRAELNEGKVRLTGVAPSDAARGKVVVEAKRWFPRAAIQDATTAGKLDDGASWSAAAEIALRALSMLDEGEVLAEKGAFVLTGKTGDASIAAGAARSMESIRGLYRGASAIDVTAPQAAPEESPDQIAQILIAEHGEAIEACRRALAEIFGARPITFASSSTRLRAEERLQLADAAEALGQCPEASVVVEGHTDNRGDDGFNFRISLSRARAVADTLAAAGVERARLRTEGLGGSRPIASNNTRQGRAQNRRIEIRVEPAYAGIRE
jgi:outer membrane protein OmpA-like peptidoglycan-associated protein